MPGFEVNCGSPGHSDPFLGERFVDDITGQPLDPELCRIARRKEIEYFQSKGVWDMRRVQEAWAKTGRPPISVRWVEVNKDKLIVAKKKFNSRLIVGTGKYKSMSECAKAIKLSGAEIVTVAVRRVNISDKKKPLLMDYIDPKKITYLPNTAGCFNSEEALRTLRLAREIGGWKLVKLEVLGDKKNLFPDMIETLKSTEVLTKEGFKVMVYCTDDPLMAKRLEDVGACAIMPLAAPIGSGLGIQNVTNIKIIRDQTKLPLIIDAGLGQASDAAIAMELGCDGVLANTAIAKAKKPFQMASAFKNAVIAGRQSFLAGRIEKSIYGKASSPTNGII